MVRARFSAAYELLVMSQPSRRCASYTTKGTHLRTAFGADVSNTAFVDGVRLHSVRWLVLFLRLPARN